MQSRGVNNPALRLSTIFAPWRENVFGSHKGAK